MRKYFQLWIGLLLLVLLSSCANGNSIENVEIQSSADCRLLDSYTEQINDIITKVNRPDISYDTTEQLDVDINVGKTLVSQAMSIALNCDHDLLESLINKERSFNHRLGDPARKTISARNRMTLIGQ